MTDLTERTESAEHWGARIGPPGTRAVAPAAGADADAQDSAGRRRFLVHGAALDIECGVGALAEPLDWALRRFLLPGDRHWPPTVAPLSGTIQPYELELVSRYLSPTATQLCEGPMTVSHEAGPLEVYAEEERFWLVDERWGMAEVNLLKGQWRSWVLPEPTVDAVRCVEWAVLWPMAQLLRGRGLHLLPAASAVRDGWAVLILGAHGACGLGPELSVMLDAGYRLIGQRWTAVREEEGRLALVHLPGRVERAGAQGGLGGFFGWENLTSADPHSRQNHAFCDSVLLVTPGRRPAAALRDLAPSEALALLRKDWPIAELHPTRRSGQVAGKLARQCRCAEAQLSRDPRDLLGLLDLLRAGAAPQLDWSEEPGTDAESATGAEAPRAAA